MSDTSNRLVVVHPHAESVAQDAGARMLLTLMDAQSVRRPVHLVLTGGGLGVAMLSRAAAGPLVDAVDWSGVHVWWGDERFLPVGDVDRNETQARDVLLSHVPLPTEHVHPIPGPSEAVPDARAAADAYAAELALFAAEGETVPHFDLTLLGVGEDGHVASLFPGSGIPEHSRNATWAVLDSPKPPPERVTLTHSALNRSDRVWLLAAGSSKTQAVAAALTPGSALPAARVRGARRTLWLVDVEAAKEL